MRTGLETLCLHALHHPGDDELQQIAREACCIASAHDAMHDAWSRSKLAAVINVAVIQVLANAADVPRAHALMLDYLALTLRQIEGQGIGPLPEPLAFVGRWSPESGDAVPPGRCIRPW